MNLSKYFDLTRLNRPIGIWLLLFPCLFGSVISYRHPDAMISIHELVIYMILFTVGSVIMRSAGCIINDFFDQKFDTLVLRTKNRALASGKVSKNEAIILLLILLFFGFLILLQFNQKVIFLGIFSLFLVIFYPLTKRITYFPQVFLGFTYNIGVLMASLAMLQEITISAAILYLTMIIWTLIYDTIYAYQDIEDDLKIGVRSTAIKFGKQGKKILIILNFLMFFGFISVGIINYVDLFYYLMVLIACGYLLLKVINCDFDDPKSCLEVFKSNSNFGLMVLIAMMV